MKILSLFILLSSVCMGDVLMIDMNNSTNENEACQEGANSTKDANQSKGVQVLRGDKSNPLDGASLERKISELEAQGISVDTIVLSGHDGNGHFFGENGEIMSSEMADIVSRHPKLKASLTMMALWGCYGTTDFGCQNYWMKSISPNIQATVGFVVQSPDNTQEYDTTLLKEVCSRRNEIVSSAIEGSLSDTFHSFPGVSDWKVGICTKDGLCSDAYKAPGDTSNNCMHSYEELKNRCSEYDPDKTSPGNHPLTKEFEKYMTAADKDHVDPPCDKTGDLSDAGDGKCPELGEHSKLRYFYDQAAMWEQCREQYATENGYEYPDPNQVVRLVKFKAIATNFGAMEADEIRDYNAKLKTLGRFELPGPPAQVFDFNPNTIPDLSKASRAEIITSTKGGKEELERLISQIPPGATVRGIDPRKMLVMADGLDLSLRQLDPACTDMTWVHQRINGEKSLCLAPYGGSPRWPPK